MGMWTAIALICVTGIVASIFTDKGRRKERREAARELEDLQARLDKLEDDLRRRVETLERIVTNPKDDLKRQFDELG